MTSHLNYDVTQDEPVHIHLHDRLPLGPLPPSHIRTQVQADAAEVPRPQRPLLRHVHAHAQPTVSCTFFIQYFFCSYFCFEGDIKGLLYYVRNIVYFKSSYFELRIV